MEEEYPEGTDDWSKKLTGLPTQLPAENEKSATGFGLTRTCFVIVLIHPFELVTVNVTL